MVKTKDDINTIAMEVILNAGNGGELIDKALEEISKFNFNRADDLIDEATKDIIKAHNAQTSIIQNQVSGNDVEYSLLFIHAQDTLMTIKSRLTMFKGLEPIIKNLYEGSKK